MVRIAVVALVGLVPVVALGDEPSFVIPGGQEPLVGRMLGAGGPVAGCNLASAAIEATRIVARYHCGQDAEDVRVTLEHPSTPGAQVGRTTLFAIRSGDVGRAPPAFVDALRTRLQQGEAPFVWTSPNSDRAYESGRDRPRRAENGGNAPAPWQLDVRAVAVLALSLLCAALLRKRRAFVSVAPLVRAAVVLGAATIIAGFAFAWSIRGTDKPPRFGSIYTWHGHGTLTESDLHRPHVDYRVNAGGFRGHEWPERPEAGTFRGVVIGDSFVAGLGVEWPDTISERLAAALPTQGTLSRVEVLNLGIPGNKLPQDVRVYETAVTRLEPDFAVLCVRLPDDLSDWSSQDEVVDFDRVSPLSITSFALGRARAATWFASHARARTMDDRALRVLDRELTRLGGERRRNGGPPLFIFAYSFDVGVLESRVRGWRDTYVLPAVASRPDFVIPGDGHPTAAANREYGDRIAHAILEVPALAARLRP